jgi:hypothetical protein
MKIGKKRTGKYMKIMIVCIFHALFVHAKIVKKVVRQKIYYKKLMML